MDAFWDKPKVMVERQELSFFSDLSLLTVKKSTEFKFLTIKLIRLGIPCKWGFPFKLLTEYQRKIIDVWTLEQARDFETEHDNRGS